MYEWRKELGLSLKQFRKQKGWKQSDVQAITGIPRQVVSEIENGKFNGAIVTLERYMLVANITFHIESAVNEYPQLDQLDALFGDDDE